MPRIPGFLPCSRVLAAAVLWAASGAMAQPVDGALAKLYGDKNWTQALVLIDRELLRQPGDAQLQIQRGVVLTNLNRADDALAQFRKVAASHPELPGPHNNVAVLLAARGEFQEARLALERAIRTHPSYATAHENLGDLYSHMAAEAYRKALRYDKQGTAARPKLALVDGMQPATTGSTAAVASPAASVALAPRLPVAVPPAPPPAPTPAPAPAPVVTAAAPPAPKPVGTAVVPPAAPPAAVTPASATAAAKTPPAPTTLATAASAPAATGTAKPAPTPTAPAAPPAPAPAQATAAAASRPAAAPPPAAAPAKAASAADAPDAAERDIQRAVTAWAAAWSQRNMSAYYSAYTADFKGKAKSHEEWKNDRKDRIEGKKRIEVAVQGLQIKVTGKLAKVTMVQGYKSDALSTTGPKSMVLENVGGKWLIQQENAGR